VRAARFRARLRPCLEAGALLALAVAAGMWLGLNL
jgi:hypothetical protein